MSLRRQAAQGAHWTGVCSIVIAILQIVQLIVLARLLAPDDFGLMAMLFVVIGFAQLYADMGMSNAIIHRQDATPDHLSTLYWTNVLTGVFVFAALLAASPLIVVLYSEPRLAEYIPLAAASVLILAFGQQYQALLQKSLKFKELATGEMVAAFAGAAVAIVSALSGQGIYALIYGQLTNALVRTLSYIGFYWQEWRPSLHFKCRDLQNYLSFSLYQLGERSINYFGQRVDQLLIGAVLGATALGYYSLAYNLVIWPMQRINPALTRVAFPIFARVQDDVERLKVGFMTVIRILASVNFPTMVGIAVVSPLLVPLILGEKWLPSVVLIQVLACVALFRSTGNPIGALLLARGRAGLAFHWNLGIVVVLVPVIYVGARYYGTLGVAVAIAATQFIYFWAGYFVLVRSQLGPSLGLYLRSIAPATITSLSMGVLVGAMSALNDTPALLWLSFEVVVGMVVYGFLNWFLFRNDTVALVRLVRSESA